MIVLDWFEIARNYLRVRGEYDSLKSMIWRSRELPPRARRIPCPCTYRIVQIGTTSACAENTGDAYRPPSGSWNYLRVRGEYHYQRWSLPWLLELPPRARRIRYILSRRSSSVGTTSACAENTVSCPTPRSRQGNYLRVRGEYRS